MDNVKLSFLVDLLESSLSDKKNLHDHMMKFEDLVGNFEIIGATEQQKFELSELAFDVAYFSVSHAYEDPSLFGKTRMVELIEETLIKVKKLS